MGAINIILKKANKSDYGAFYELLKERENNINISHKKMPSREKSDKFNASKPYAYDFVVLINNKRAGRVYITRANEIGISIKKEYQNKRYDRKIIALLFDRVRLKKYYANIAPLNIRSQKFFKRLGFRLIQYVYTKNMRK